MSRFADAANPDKLPWYTPFSLKAANPNLEGVLTDLDGWINTGKRPKAKNSVELVTNLAKYTTAVGIANVIAPPLGNALVMGNVAYSLFNRLDRRRYQLKDIGSPAALRTAAAYDLMLAVPGLGFQGAFNALDKFGGIILGNGDIAKTVVKISKWDISAGGDITKNTGKVIDFIDGFSKVLNPKPNPFLDKAREAKPADKPKAA